MAERLPDWAHWSEAGVDHPWTVGVEEEVMLLDAGGTALANRIDDVLAAAPPALQAHTSAETHACLIELKTSPHATVADMASELAVLRRWLDALLRDELGLRAAVAGTHPTTTFSEVAVSSSSRYRKIEALTRAVAHREPTMALHVHVAVPDGSAAVRALDGLRSDLPLLLALSANSPFWRGSDTGFASIRTPILSMFPRFGIPRHFGRYANYVRVVERMLRSGAVPEPGFLWWDVRLQPRRGTVEVRIMDAQCRVEDVAALAALVQCLVRLHAEVPRPSTLELEVLAENRFLAARDGMSAQLVEGPLGSPRPVRRRLDELLEECGPVARMLGCAAELAGVERLAANPGDERQRRLATRHGLEALPALLGADFVPGGWATRAASPLSDEGTAAAGRHAVWSV
jgi:glutamate---cysteine ligase / carboxylate-amine ligase